MVDCILVLNFSLLPPLPVKGLYISVPIELAKWHALGNWMWVGVMDFTSKQAVSEALLEFSPAFFHFPSTTRMGMSHGAQNEKTHGAEPNRPTAVASDINKSKKCMCFVNDWNFRVVCYAAKLTYTSTPSFWEGLRSLEENRLWLKSQLCQTSNAGWPWASHFTPWGPIFLICEMG